MSSITFDKVHKYFYLQHQKTVKELVQAIFVRQKTLERVHALEDVNFTVEKGDSIGVIGKNGAGKSTLLKLIAKVSYPTSGKVETQGRIAPLIELGAGFHPELTGRENIVLNGVILGMTEKYIKSVINDIISFAEIEKFIDTPIKFYSSGMYMRLAFSVAIFTKPDILLVDEILAVGDVAFQEKCMKKMNEFKKNGVTIIYVSHALGTVKAFCNKVLYLKEGKLVFNGDTTQGLQMFEKDINI